MTSSSRQEEFKNRKLTQTQTDHPGTPVVLRPDVRHHVPDSSAPKGGDSGDGSNNDRRVASLDELLPFVFVRLLPFL